jgi:UPF0755 protein
MAELHPFDELVGGRPEDHDHPPARRRRRKKRRRGRRFVVLVAALLVVGLGVYAGVAAVKPIYKSLTAGDDYSGSGSGSVTVLIQPGQSGRSIGDTLQKDGVVKSASAFADAAAGNPDSAGIQPGTYTMHAKMSAASALALLLDPTTRVTDKIVVREGLRATATIALLAKQTGQPLSAYQAALKHPAALGVPSWANGKVEGLLWPATYEFQPKTTAAQQLSQMVHLTLSQLSKQNVSDSQALKVLTIASIVQVESRAAADGPKVARVLDNRLSQGIKLQLDSTVSYVTGKPGVATTSADRANPSPYNTYVHAGLPPGPISNPGLAAIQAALHPAAGPWLWFVTVNPSTGETRFESTEAQKLADTRLFNQWCAAHTAACRGTGS